MNKEQLDQLALEVADTHSAPYASVEQTVIDFATRFLAAVDELRAKEANGFLVVDHDDDGCIVSAALPIGTELFLHPQQEKAGWKPIQFTRTDIKLIKDALERNLLFMLTPVVDRVVQPFTQTTDALTVVKRMLAAAPEDKP